MSTWLNHQELFWGAIFTAALWKKHISWRVMWMLLLYLAIGFFCRDLAPSGMESTHFLAPAHIMATLAGKISFLCAICLGLCSKECTSEVRFALLLEVTGLVLGMFWAFDAPNWGSLWQWDSVENMSLLVVLLLAAWYQHPEFARLWAFCGLILLIFENTMIYGGMMGAESRHQYTLIHPEFVAGMIAWGAGCLLVSRFKYCELKRFNAKIMDWRSTSLGVVIICIAPWIGLGHRILPLSMAVLSILFWCLLTASRKTAIRFILGIVTMICLCCPPAFEQTIARVPSLENKNSWELAGIHLDSVDDCYHYMGTVAFRGTEVDVPLDICGTQTISPRFVELRSGAEFYRIWGISYRAADGFGLTVRHVTLEKYLEIWILFIFIFFLYRIIRRAIKQSESIQEG